MLSSYVIPKFKDSKVFQARSTGRISVSIVTIDRKPFDNRLIDKCSGRASPCVRHPANPFSVKHSLDRTQEWAVKRRVIKQVRADNRFKWLQVWWSMPIEHQGLLRTQAILKCVPSGQMDRFRNVIGKRDFTP